MQIRLFFQEIDSNGDKLLSVQELTDFINSEDETGGKKLFKKLTNEEFVRG